MSSDTGAEQPGASKEHASAARFRGTVVAVIIWACSQQVTTFPPHTPSVLSNMLYVSAAKLEWNVVSCKDSDLISSYDDAESIRLGNAAGSARDNPVLH